MKFLDWIGRIDRWLIKPEQILLVALFWLLIVVIGIQVVCRYWLFIPTPWAEELARFAFIWVAYLGASVAIYHNENITIDLIGPLYVGLFRIRNRAALEKFLIIVNAILIIPFLVIFSWLNWEFLQSIAGFTQYSPAARINMLYPMSAILVGSVLMLIHMIAAAGRNFAAVEPTKEVVS